MSNKLAILILIFLLMFLFCFNLIDCREKIPVERETEEIETSITAPSPPKAFSIAHTMLRIESHSDPNLPDGNIYGLFAVSATLKEDIISSFYFIAKKDIPTYKEQYDFIVGGNLMKMFDKGSFVVGVSSSEQAAPIPFFDPGTTNTFFASLNYKYSEVGKTKTELSCLYFAAPHPNDNEVIGLRITRTMPVESFLGTFYYQYNYSLDREYQISNNYSVELSKQLSNRVKYSLGFMYVDKVYEAGAGMFPAYDDEIYRLTISKSY